MSAPPSLKRDAFLSVLRKLGVEMEAARGGGSLIKLRFRGRYCSFHVHPRATIGPALGAKILRQLGIDVDEFTRAR